MISNLRIGIVIGTRPEIIKNYAIVKELKRRGVEFYVLHTNQHSIYSMHQLLFEELSYEADFVANGNYSIGNSIDWIYRMIRRLALDLIITNGDTAASLAGSIAAIYSDIGLAHVEAGLRSFDKLMYEERNRIMVDAASHYLFTYTDMEQAYLQKIPHLRGRIFCVGNTSIDLIEDFKDQINEPEENSYSYVTLHRKEFTDRKSVMVEVFSTLNELAERFQHVIFPVHPRTLDAMKKHGLSLNILDRVTLLEPVSVIKSLSYEKYADIILTDSGCIQEEACIFNTPCVTIRESTERPMTVEIGANIVSGLNRTNIKKAVDIQLSNKGIRYPQIYGPAGAGKRIVEIIMNNFVSFREY